MLGTWTRPMGWEHFAFQYSINGICQGNSGSPGLVSLQPVSTCMDFRIMEIKILSVTLMILFRPGQEHTVSSRRTVRFGTAFGKLYDMWPITRWKQTVDWWELFLKVILTNELSRYEAKTWHSGQHSFLDRTYIKISFGTSWGIKIVTVRNRTRQSMQNLKRITLTHLLLRIVFTMQAEEEAFWSRG